jgi:hypothetical protein
MTDEIASAELPKPTKLTARFFQRKEHPIMTAEAQLNFAKQALQEALDRMEPELVAANEAAHKVVKLE